MSIEGKIFFEAGVTSSQKENEWAKSGFRYRYVHISSENGKTGTYLFSNKIGAKKFIAELLLINTEDALALLKPIKREPGDPLVWQKNKLEKNRARRVQEEERAAAKHNMPVEEYREFKKDMNALARHIKAEESYKDQARKLFEHAKRAREKKNEIRKKWAKYLKK